MTSPMNPSARPPSVMSQLADRLLKMPSIASEGGVLELRNVNNMQDTSEDSISIKDNLVNLRPRSPPVTPAKRICRSSSAHAILHRPIALRPSRVMVGLSSRTPMDQSRHINPRRRVILSSLGGEGSALMAASSTSVSMSTSHYSSDFSSTFKSKPCMTLSLQEPHPTNVSLNGKQESTARILSCEAFKLPIADRRRSAFTAAIPFESESFVTTSGTNSDDSGLSPGCTHSLSHEHATLERHTCCLSTHKVESQSMNIDSNLYANTPSSPSSGFCGDSVSPGTSLRCSSSISYTYALERAASATAADTSLSSVSYSPESITDIPNITSLCFMHPQSDVNENHPKPSLRTTRCKSQPACHWPNRHSIHFPPSRSDASYAAQRCPCSVSVLVPRSSSDYTSISCTLMMNSTALKRKYDEDRNRVAMLASQSNGLPTRHQVMRDRESSPSGELLDETHSLPNLPRMHRSFGNTRRCLFSLPRIVSSPLPDEKPSSVGPSSVTDVNVSPENGTSSPSLLSSPLAPRIIELSSSNQQLHQTSASQLCCGRGSEASTLTGLSSRGDTPTQILQLQYSSQSFNQVLSLSTNGVTSTMDFHIPTASSPLLPPSPLPLEDNPDSDHLKGENCIFQPISLQDSPLSNHSSDSSGESSSHLSGHLSPDLHPPPPSSHHNRRPSCPNETSPGEVHTHQWMSEYSNHFQELDLDLIEQDF